MEKAGFGAALLQCQDFKSLFQSGRPSPNFPVSLFLYLQGFVSVFEVEFHYIVLLPRLLGKLD